MPLTRPSGIPIVRVEEAPVSQEVAQIDSRGRLNLLPRWTKRIDWMPNEPVELLALMVFQEPGLITICSWEGEGQRVEQRYKELALQEDAIALDALRLIQDRYQKLIVPPQRRCSLGQAALAHLGFPAPPGKEQTLYVAVYSTKIDLLSPSCRNRKLLAGNPLLDDLP